MRVWTAKKNGFADIASGGWFRRMSSESFLSEVLHTTCYEREPQLNCACRSIEHHTFQSLTIATRRLRHPHRSVPVEAEKQLTFRLFEVLYFLFPRRARILCTIP
jgi:hypothetical protein